MYEKYKPPKKFFKYLKTEYVRSSYLSDQQLSELLIASYGAVAWVKSTKGAHWAFEILGVQELSPHPAFEYIQTLYTLEKKIIPHGELRIFKSGNEKKSDILKESIEVSKRIIYTEGWKVPDEQTIKSVIIYFRDWLRSRDGQEWMCENFAAIKYLARQGSGGVVYRHQTVTADVTWVLSERVKIECKEEEHCDCCEYSFPCLNDFNDSGSLCNRCFSENFAETESIVWCGRFECELYGCHNYLAPEKLKRMRTEIKELPIKWSSHG